MLSDVIYRPMWRKRWRHTWSCKNRHMWYVSSVPVYQIRFLPYGCENTELGAVQQLSSKPAQWDNSVTCGNQSLMMSAVTRNNQQRQSFLILWMMHIFGVSIKSMAIFWCVKAAAISGRCDWDSEQSKIGITMLLGLTPAFIQWFSPKSHTQGIFNWRRVLRTHILMFYSIWYEVIIGLRYRILAIFHVY